MRKRLLTGLLALVFCTALLPTVAWADDPAPATNWASYAVTDWYNENDDKFTITTAEQLAGLAQLVNDGNNFSGKIIALGADIDLNPGHTYTQSADGTWVWSSGTDNLIQWTPIGTYTDWDDYLAFSGTFNGNGHAISGLYIDTTTIYSVGLFGCVSNGGVVKKLSVSGSVTSTGSDNVYAGGVVGYNDGATIDSCISTGTICAVAMSNHTNLVAVAGGVVGNNDGIVIDCTNNGDVTGNGSGNSYTGGVVGSSSGRNSMVTGCANTGTISGNITGYAVFSLIGGVVGNSGGTVSECYNFGEVNAMASGDHSAPYAGGVVGTNGYRVVNCHNEGTVNAIAPSGLFASAYSGGVTGRNGSGCEVASCSNTGKVSANATGERAFDYAGGVAGSNAAVGNNNITAITNCYNTGNISGDSAGGIVSQNGASDGGTAFIENCYNIGNVSGDIAAGGVVEANGANYGGIATVIGCYYLNTCGASGQEGTSIDEDAFAMQATFTGWDFEKVWAMDENLGRPVLVHYTKPEKPKPPYIPPVPSYLITLPDPDNGTVTSNRTTARQGATVILTVIPDDGYTLSEISVTDFFGSRVDVTRNSDGTYSFVMPYSQVEVSVTFAAEEPIVFTDVPEGAYYYDPVYWAVANGVTDGTSETEFSPGRTVTRGEMVTFLWRAAGSPEPAATVNPFTDVGVDDYYYTAVLWAVENGITDGVSATEFDPDGQCTRAQMVTFLWRAAGQPASGTSNPFTDVDGEEYYYKAVLWAAANGVTDGTSDTQFSPDGDCTRAQAVTFLYRAQG